MYIYLKGGGERAKERERERENGRKETTLHRQYIVICLHTAQYEQLN